MRPVHGRVESSRGEDGMLSCDAVRGAREDCEQGIEGRPDENAFQNGRI